MLYRLKVSPLKGDNKGRTLTIVKPTTTKHNPGDIVTILGRTVSVISCTPIPSK